VFSLIKINVLASIASINTESHPFYEAFLGSFQATLLEFGGVKLSLASILTLGIRIIVVFLVARTIKLFLKNRILKQLGLDLGTRESLTRIVYYFAIAAGCLLVLQSVGIQLGSLAVFAGALGIGVGLGLQNLVANFISGIMLLVERPIKVGDFVEVNNLQGTVEQIAIRSTIIRTNQGAAVIVPNNSFLDILAASKKWTFRPAIASAI
jgi:small-conductance mechanosensitive channel